ncbi:MAG: NAD-dependent epimerase/dehydratase family protein [Myxococcota bacterium]
MKAFVTGGSGYVGRNLIRRLVAEGAQVRALARSDRSASAVETVGATSVRGDLAALDALREGSRDCDVVIHCAAKVDEWGTSSDYDAINVDGTVNVLEAARDVGAGRFVHISTEAVLAGDRALVRVDESTPFPARPAGDYARTKGLAEVRIRESTGIPWVIVRPRFVWGGDDTTLIPAFRDAVEEGRFAWIGSGAHLTSTCHVDNLVEALWLASTHPDASGCYFVTDGDPMPFRRFLTDLMATAGVSLPDKRVPVWLARLVAGGGEVFWRTFGLRGKPPITRMVVTLLGREVTVDDRRIREELGFRNVIDRATGLAQLRARA